MECDICKKKLNHTIHTKDLFRVEGYNLYTGTITPVTIRGEDGEEERKFNKIEKPRIITLCNECLAKKEVIKSVSQFEAPKGV